MVWKDLSIFLDQSCAGLTGSWLPRQQNINYVRRIRTAFFVVVIGKTNSIFKIERHPKLVWIWKWCVASRICKTKQWHFEYTLYVSAVNLLRFDVEKKDDRLFRFLSNFFAFNKNSLRWWKPGGICQYSWTAVMGNLRCVKRSFGEILVELLKSKNLADNSIINVFFTSR